MRKACVLLFGASLAAAACGKSESDSDSSPEPTPHAGETGTGAAGLGGSKAQGGDTGTGGRAEGGEPSEGGAPAPGSGGLPLAGRGGGSSGGAADGGTAGGGGSSGGTTGGAGATGGSSTAGTGGIALPDSCVSHSQHGAGKYCSAELTCARGTLALSCEERADFWYCACSNGDAVLEYEFPDTTGSETCEIAAKICLEPERLTGEEACQRSETSDIVSCRLDDVCETTHDVDGVTVVTRRTWHPGCEPCSDGVTTCCYCTGVDPPDYWVRDAEVGAGCGFLDELCKDEPLEQVGARTCDPVVAEAFPNYGLCDASVLCGRPVELGDGSRLTLSEHFKTRCVTAAANDARCGCAADDGWDRVVLRFALPPTNVETCIATTEVCAGLETLELSGQRACTNTQRTVAAYGCSLTIACEEEATVSDTAVTVLSQFGAGCQHLGADNWTCGCSEPPGGSARGRFELKAHDSEAACVAAAAACPTLWPHQ
jgi:hypothetical protein